MSFCLQQNRNWEGRHGRRGWNNMFGKQGASSLWGDTRPGASTEQLAAPGMHAFSPGRVAKGAGLPTKPDGRLLFNYLRLLGDGPL